MPRSGWVKPATDRRLSDLKNNLFKIWNRMASGSYFPPPARAV
jgi:retron-type reverse transcriptase